MQIYLVGGAVRDAQLGRAIKDRDYVVVGGTPEQLLELGYKPVGKDFPVFLHPKTGEEYALARTERKSGRGYHGFTFLTDPTVTLEADLARRDLTINAMAQAADGTLVDPYGGARDLADRLLRHVAPAFVEDPVRVLRVARFAARYAPLGFRIAEDTMDLMRSMVVNGEIDHLVAERVWAETERALAETAPAAYLRSLRECGALRVLFPELDRLYGVPQRAEFHPEVDTGIHMELVLEAAAKIAPGNALVAYACFCHDLGKALTPADILPKHIGHEESGVAQVIALSERYKVPAEFRELAVLTCRLHLQAHCAFELRTATVLKLLEQLDAFRRPERLAAFLLACEADKKGRLGSADAAYPQADYLRRCYAAARDIQARQFVDAGLTGPAVGDAMRQARIGALAEVAKAEQRDDQKC